ncbi:interphotoreceptor retinoid-binding protein [Amycolatopsis mediterranei S699]|uniref:Interphotoreceptor retinoid-binding protein n=2 Tax=Amycolatopsis mediterranei TaxID=33910 RepID=A0A0H3CXC6_AMYMU|nr:S41 family peptidase [Amycolatopsis mediterranei]ADJ41986.1 interphotoreceptor retinoid-binding protein [Amycolatopsis mediterranei U32]AEK38659.1 interphotoreceptor retinoid-binding protein [Amycolatopsis mediterranei S699]AFO73696.1 interphotoreceptor retinoid-binding protein [Amycolatopsis mediterranei S699]AGT80825.1 interphotoreceptor retinoid-binding protein [Amycolatopsis mediterranei RB]KDO08818.1 interphotoreceptor retinoid-binding protein [Amycolatopsis mediterranei]
MGSQARAAQVEEVIRRLEAHYVFPDVAAKLAEVLRARLGEGTYADLGDADFATAVTADLQSVNDDKHLRLRHHAGPVAEDGDAEHASEDFRQTAELENFGIASARRLPGNVGYVDTTLLYPLDLAAAAVSAAMTLVAPADALLLDVRRNRGGTPDTSAFLQSYLVDERTHYLDIYEREGDLVTQMWTLPYVPGPKFGGTKPIWVLTGPATFSGGEDLAFSLQRQGRAKTVGESTRGGAHPREQYKVDIYLDVTVSIARSYDPKSGENWEGIGVRPDIPVAADKAFDTAYELALRHVLELGDAGPRRVVADEARAALDEL